ncbi:hypothetical protein [Pseudomonas nitroreducens]|uniref:hypothetical protein n=1 Tax=Pseudomonas nitroreducens TaxID=46680 RepID=UPI001479E66C|nr:hypothetical protein [Pseudomonas nitroreducens]NNN24328.1 hypothetical protein [Pseudomonas nitroreducens]
MTINKLQIVRTIQNASYNDSQVAELLLELGKFISDPELSLRTQRMTRQMHEDSKELEEVSISIMGGCVAICFHSPTYRCSNCLI